MANIVRTTNRPGSVRPTPPKTRVVLVRHPVKSVRPAEQGERLPLRLAIGTIATIGAVGAVWLIGHLGFRLGFAPLLRVPHLSDDPIGGLASGITILLKMPLMVFEAGLAGPEWLMLAFALIAIPAAGLGAARPRSPGGPRPPTVVDVFAVLGAIGAGLNAAALVGWTTSPFRQAMLQPLPFQPSNVEVWAQQLQVAAGLDVLATVVCALWVVLVLRLPLQLWLKSLAATVSIFVLALATVETSISNATATAVREPRSLCLDEATGSIRGRLLLGATRHQQALLRVENNAILVETVPASGLTIVGTQSVVDYLLEHAPEEED